MITKKTLGSNLLGLGLLSHFNALWIGMVPSMSEFGLGLYLLGFFLLISAMAVEWIDQQKDLMFYIACCTSILPLIGPLIAFKMAYSHCTKESEFSHKKGWIVSLFTLSIHPIAFLLWIIALISIGLLLC